MGRHVVLVYALLAACGGNKKPAEKPVPKQENVDKPAPPPETEADREKKRHAIAISIIPEGSTCLPASLKDDNAPRLEMAAVDKDAIVCAIDTDPTRLLGPIACWKLDLKSGALEAHETAPLPGRGYDVKLDDRCARGYCLPKDAKIEGKIAHIALNLDGTQAAVLVGSDVHLFDIASRSHLSSFSVRGDKGVSNDPVAVHFVGTASAPDKAMIFVEGADQGPFSAVWAFKVDGTLAGPITAIGHEDKPLSTYHGAFSILDANRVAVAERGYETLTIYEVESGKRTKLPRKVGKPTCKPDELDAYWKDGDKVTDRCKASMNKLFGHLVGATTIAGSTSFLALLRNDRLGELAVLDAKTLVEKRTLKMPWCDAGKAPAAEKPADTRAPKRKPAKSGDPEEGGE